MSVPSYKPGLGGRGSGECGIPGGIFHKKPSLSTAEETPLAHAYIYIICISYMVYIDIILYVSYNTRFIYTNVLCLCKTPGFMPMSQSQNKQSW